jgi:hypothetical protein
VNPPPAAASSVTQICRKPATATIPKEFISSLLTWSELTVPRTMGRGMMMVMLRKNTKRASSEATLLEVQKEMDKPRIAESARRPAAVDPGRQVRRRQTVKPVVVVFESSLLP